MRDGFLHAILDAPEDDTPRLIYADWLDDHAQCRSDQARAELIRIQCRMARAAVPAIADELRAEDILDLYGDDWRSELPTLDGIRWAGFERGFPTWAVPQDLDTLHRHADALRGTTVRKIRFHHESFDPAPELPQGWPGVAGLSGLEFSFWDFDASQVALLAAAELITGLETLAITYSDFDAASMSELAASARLARLRHLDLTNHLLDAAGLRVLASSPYLRSLRLLDLSHDALTEDDHNRFNDDAMDALAAAENLSQLTTLRLCPFRLTSRGCAALASSAHLTNLHHLALASGELEVGALVPLLGSSLLANLQKFDLRDLPLTLANLRMLLLAPRPTNLFTMALDLRESGHAGVSALLNSEWGNGLTELLLDGGTGLDEPLPVLALGAKADSLASLEQLYLQKMNVNDEALRMLSRVHFPRLASLHLGYTVNVTLAGLRDFADGPGLPALRRLHFSGSCLGGMIVEALAGSALASRLTHLDLSHQRLGPWDVGPLLDRSRWPRLARLVLSRNILGHHAHDALRETWDDAVVLDDPSSEP